MMDSTCSPRTRARKRPRRADTETTWVAGSSSRYLQDTAAGTTMKNIARLSRVKKAATASESPVASDQSWVPKHWRQVLDNVRQMRTQKDAPVDVMGAEHCADPCSPPNVQRFQVLVSLMLSSQTKDQATYVAMQKLKAHGLTVENTISADEDVIAQLIHPVGFWKRKAGYIKRTAEILARDYNNDIPTTVKELCTLPGVGPKMATICANIAWEDAAGIGVDTHVHRIANRLGWVPQPTKTPEETQKALERWLPRPLWKEVNVLFVGFGQQLCTPVRPKCAQCLNKDICPYGSKNLQF